ncbi:MAG: PHP domain-containing protein [Chloroflexi bacterium]|nr:PHP domain-containing protein [Chloroflexota bacterium]
MPWHEYVGVIHLHTTSSDGTKTHEEVAKIAIREGLDFIIVTDHNRLVKEQEGWQGPLLLLVGEEIHDTHRNPQASHYLAFGIQEEVAQHAAEPQALIEAVNNQRGFGFLAHPYEIAPPFTREPDLSWADWEVEEYAGLEVWNYMSEFKARATSLPATLLYAYFPGLAIHGPFSQTLQRWDQLLTTRKVAVLGGADVHGKIYRLGPLRRAILSYEHCFRALRTHILVPEPFNGQLEHDRGLVNDALREGCSSTAYDMIGNAVSFRFLAKSPLGAAIMGQEIPLGEDPEFWVSSPLPADLRLIHNGQVVAQDQGKALRYHPREKGYYRVEAYRRHFLKKRGWVFTNPIYIV